MNVLHMKYAVEVAKAGTLSRASETLLIAQPNISRSIKELESDLGITIFERTAKGMVLTPEGEVFIGYAKDIINQIDEVEKMYKDSTPRKQRFSISVPRASYISDAFVRFSKQLTDEAAELHYNETSARKTIENVVNQDYNLGIVRYAADYDAAFKNMLEEKGLHYELVTQFTCLLTVHQDHPLAKKGKVALSDLEGYIEIDYADPFVPSLALSKMMKEEQTPENERKIYVFERASQFGLLSENRETFMWLEPVLPQMLSRYGLVQVPCDEQCRLYKDMLIYRNGYSLSTLERQFLTLLIDAKREYM